MTISWSNDINEPFDYRYYYRYQLYLVNEKRCTYRVIIFMVDISARRCIVYKLSLGVFDKYELIIPIHIDMLI